jgi:formylglycine-generating enzyme required for sulfatase activity
VEDDECPPVSVAVDAFYIDSHEVTAGQFDACRASGACSASTYTECSENTACNYSPPGTADGSCQDRELRPMNCVDHDGAAAYCELMGGRLPTEAEWELAARGVEGRPYPWDGPLDLARVCAPGGASCATSPLSCPVGSYPDGATPEGIVDMTGNVDEWTSDHYDPEYYTDLDALPAPVDNPTSACCGDDFTARGGNYCDATDDTLSPSNRRSRDDNTDELSSLGFRCLFPAVPE